MSVVFNYIDLVRNQKLKTACIANGIIDAISDKALKKGEALPSVNRFLQKLPVARMTVVKALNKLKERGIIISVNKVGYFVRDTDTKRELKVMLFLSAFNSYQETIYNQIIGGLGDAKITVDLFFHNCNPKIFNSLIKENLGLYGLYIVSVFDDASIIPSLSRIPKRKLLQILRPPLLPEVSSISQDFYLELKEPLESLISKLKNYDEFILILSSIHKYPTGLKRAFEEFFQKSKIKFSIEKKIDKNLIGSKKAFGVFEDSDLIRLIELCEEANYEIGKDVGVVSYNETPMKKIIRNGITVISADFSLIGKNIAEFILNPEHTVKVFAPKLILRKSI